ARMPRGRLTGTGRLRAEATSAAPGTATGHHPASPAASGRTFRNERAAPARALAQDLGTAHWLRCRTVAGDTGSPRPGTAAPPIRVHERRRGRPERTWRSCRTSEQPGE